MVDMEDITEGIGVNPFQGPVRPYSPTRGEKDWSKKKKSALNPPKKRVLDPFYTTVTKVPFEATITCENGRSYLVDVTDTDVEFIGWCDEGDELQWVIEGP